MSDFKAADEAVLALVDGLALELKSFAPTQSAAERFLGCNCCNLYLMFLDFGEDAFAGVSRPALGTGKPVLCLTVSDMLKWHATLAAKRFYGLISH